MKNIVFFVKIAWLINKLSILLSINTHLTPLAQVPTVTGCLHSHQWIVFPSSAILTNSVVHCAACVRWWCPQFFTPTTLLLAPSASPLREPDPWHWIPELSVQLCRRWVAAKNRTPLAKIGCFLRSIKVGAYSASLPFLRRTPSPSISWVELCTYTCAFCEWLGGRNWCPGIIWYNICEKFPEMVT